MAKSKTKDLREFYGNLLGEDLVAKLSDKQIKIISSYYENLSEKEKEKINDAISEGKSHDLLEMAEGFVQESEEDVKPNPKKRKTKVKKTEDNPPGSPPNNIGGGNGGGNKSGALAKYEGTNDEDLVGEEIDERILKLLGIKDAIGFDYGDYKTLLRERLMSARMGDSKIPVEEDELIRDEFKRVKSKTGRFKVKSVKKISVDKFIPKATFSKPKEQYLLTNKISTVSDQEEDKKDLKLEEKSSLLEQVIEIKKSVDNILSLLSRQNTAIKKQSEGERLDKERRSKRKKEDSLEKIKASAKGVIKEVIAPVQSILDKIINFFVWVILGRAVTKFLEWARDPQNKSKVEALGNLLKNFWPAILGAFVLFTTPLGKFIRVVVGTITKFTFQLLRKGIPALTRFLKNRNKDRDRVTDDSRRRNRRGGRPRVTEGAGDRLSKKPSRFGGARGGLLGTLAFVGLEMATPFLSEKVGELYSNLKIGDAGLSDEDLLKEYQREKSNIDRKTSGPFGDLLSQRTDYSRLEGLEEELNRRGIAYRGGGEIFSGVVGKNDGMKFSGAGPDTQAFPVEGGGVAVLKPKELVLNEEQQKQLQLDTGVDPKSYVADARPRQVSGKMFGYNSGGMIGGVPQGPYTPLPSPGYVRPEGGFIPRPNLRGMPGPMGKPMPWGYNPFQGLKGGGKINRGRSNLSAGANNSRKIQDMRLGASLINIGPIDTNLPRPMTGFRDLAEVQYQNNRGVKGFKGGGVIGMQNGGPIPYSRGTNQFGEVPLIRAALSSGIKGRELAAFLAQMSHETGGFKWNRELGRGKGMGYSGGDMYHGRGYTQLTHDYNYRDFGNKLGVDLLKDPDLLLKDPNLSAKVAIQYWKERVRPSVKNWDDVFSHSAAINYPGARNPGQINGYGDRLAKYNYYNKNLESIINRSLPPKPKPKPKPKSVLDNVSDFFSGIGSFFGQGAIASPKKKQGGGDITPESLEKTYREGQKSGMSSDVLKAIGDEAFLLKNFGLGGTWRNFKGSGASNMRGEPLPRKKGGGSIIPVTTNFGKDIPGGKMGADTQYWPQENVALQPGEEIFKYVVTKDAAEKGLGERLLSFADSQQKLLDSNSTASNIVKSVNRNIPGPRRSKSNGSQVLPPIEQRMGSKGTPIEKNGSEVPPFPIVSSYSKRSTQMSMYGIL